MNSTPYTVSNLATALRSAINTAIEQPSEVPELPPGWLAEANAAIDTYSHSAMCYAAQTILSAHSQYKADFDTKGWLHELRQVFFTRPVQHYMDTNDVVRRHPLRSTGENLKAFLALLDDPACISATLFASPPVSTVHCCPETDGPTTNFPLLSALVKLSLPAGLGCLHVVFDGLFLHVARRPRYLEVKALLDRCVASKKVFVHLSALDFTSGMEPTVAAGKMLAAIKSEPAEILDQGSRIKFFELLSAVEEALIPA